MNRFLKFTLFGSMVLVISGFISYIFLFFIHDNFGASDLVYLCMFIINLSGYLSVPIFIVSMFIWLSSKSRRIKIVSFIFLLVLMILLFTPLLEMCRYTSFDTARCKAVFPYEFQYWTYIFESIRNPNLYQLYSQDGWGRLSLPIFNVIINEGVGDILKEIKISF